MPHELAEFFYLAPIGLVVGAFGTLIGAGGGALLVPALLLLLPGQSPARLTAISLAVVFFNAYSGTIAYARMGRINYRAGLLFATAGLPGAVLGTLVVQYVSRAVFDPLFGVLILAGGSVLIVNPLGSPRVPNAPTRALWIDDLIGAMGSAYVAVLSSLLGIGGGIIHVPFLVRVLRFDAHAATATSHFVLTIMALSATIAHLVHGELTDGIVETMCLAIGVMMGAPLGAAISPRVHGVWLVRLLALMLCGVGVRLLVRAFG